MKCRQGMVALALALAGAIAATAGKLTPAAGPGDPASQMYTTTDIYNRLDTGAAGTKATTFPEPGAGPAVQGRSLDEIMAKLPSVDDANGANPAQVLLNKTYWGLTSTGWGLKTGTMPDNGAVTITPSTVNQTIPAGYHNGSGAVQGDANLVSGNIKSGVSVFNVTGSYSDTEVTPILVARTEGAGSNADKQKGTAWPIPRFTYNGNGTVTDNLTKLIWTKNANPCESKTWADASVYCAALASGTAGLSDGSKAGDWRLPSVTERKFQPICKYKISLPLKIRTKTIPQ